MECSLHWLQHQELTCLRLVQLQSEVPRTCLSVHQLSGCLELMLLLCFICDDISIDKSLRMLRLKLTDNSNNNSSSIRTLTESGGVGVMRDSVCYFFVCPEKKDLNVYRE